MFEKRQIKDGRNIIMRNTTKINQRIIRLAALMLAMLCFTVMVVSCGSADGTTSDGASIETNPENYIKLGKYKGVEVEAIDTTVTEKDIDEALAAEFGSSDIDDEIITILTNSEYETVADYRAVKKTELEEQRVYDAKTTHLNQALEKIIADSSFTELIEAEIEAYVKDVEDYYMASNKEGTSIEEYINQNFPVTYEEFLADTRAEAEENIKTQAIIYAIGKAENVVVTKELYNKYASMYAERYSYTVAELEELLTKEAVEKNVYRDIVFDLILDNVTKK